MHFKPFRGSGPLASDNETQRRAIQIDALLDPAGYQASDALARAVNVALSLGMPLLVTGEPGTGKTQLAYRVASELKLGKPLRFDTKSSSQATDLFYAFDSVRHFAESQLASQTNGALPAAHNFVRYQALGTAILRTLPREELTGRGYDPGAAHAPHQSLVLIDEIDKAPRDFPNDLLNQMENLEFAVPELQIDRIAANRDLAPVVIITSNSEKQLPEAFLRRCVYHHIEFPPADKREQIESIVSNRLRGLGLSGAYQGALDFFYKLRDAGLVKKPSTSELLDWLRALQAAGLEANKALSAQKDVAQSCLGCLTKTREDSAKAAELLSQNTHNP